MSNLGEMIVGGMLVGASAVTGGASAQAGETVVTGDSSASVQVTNVINANNDGGTTHTIVEKTVNGVKEIIEETKTFAPGEPVIVEVEARAQSGGGQKQDSTAPTSSETEDVGAVSSSTASSSTPISSATSTIFSFGSYIFETISGWFASLWGLWN